VKEEGEIGVFCAFLVGFIHWFSRFLLGGDTLWANAYAAYDRLSRTFRTFLEGLTAANRGDPFLEASKMTGQPLAKNRGAPDNSSPIGDPLTAVHPVVCTNLVTGWKALYINLTYVRHERQTNSRRFTKRFNELCKDLVLQYLFKHVANNHDFQVRYKWTPNGMLHLTGLLIVDVVFWNNLSSFHTITLDYRTTDVRKGNRVLSLGEKAYLDPNPKSKREALGLLETYFN
jgi:alpha-ketoglutarate-dependent taurine dioxygenase